MIVSQLSKHRVSDFGTNPGTIVQSVWGPEMAGTSTVLFNNIVPGIFPHTMRTLFRSKPCQTPCSKPTQVKADSLDVE